MGDAAAGLWPRGSTDPPRPDRPPRRGDRLTSARPGIDDLREVAGSSLVSRVRRGAAKVFDAGVDDAAHDGEKTLVAQLIAAVLMAAIVAANLGIRFGFAWIGLAVLGEFFMYLLLRLRFRKGEPGTVGARALYVAGCCVIATIWASIPLAFWFVGTPGLSAAAIVITATSLIHAQAFAYRSITVLVATGGPSALVLLLLPWLGEPLTDIELMSFSLATILSIGYACASVHAHRAAARTLQALQDELERFAYFDALTSLANRRQFSDNLRKLIALSERRGTRFALLLLDLDQFKQINDTLGHDAGDALLIAVGARLRNAIRAQDNVARLGGDEFAILLSGADDPVAIAAVCERIASSCGPVVDFNGISIRSSLSVGVALFPDNGDRQDSLYKSADLALYEAKHSGRNAWRHSEVTVEQITQRVPAAAST